MRTAKLLVTVVFVSLFGVLGGAWGDVSPLDRPGALGGGITLLPNGWKIAPAGRHVQVGSLPLAMVESPDGRTLFIASNGYLKPSIIAVDIKTQRVIDTLVLDHAWLGLAWHPDGKRLYVSGAGNNTVHELRWETRRVQPRPDEDNPAPPAFNTKVLTRGADLVLGRPMLVPEPGTNRP